jgi:signal recognition particle receptor subunit beta
VIDSTDIVRMEVVKTELFTLLSHPGLWIFCEDVDDVNGLTILTKINLKIADISSRPIPILLYSNKKDLPNSVEAAEISKILDLPRILDRPITIV